MDRNRTRNDRDRHRRTISISIGGRGQTAQDFAVGIGVFILAVAFVFAFLPTILAPFESTVSGGQTAQADRIADRVVHDLSTETPNEIDGDAFESDYVDADEGDLADRLGLRASGDQVYDRVNIALEHPDGTVVESPDDWTAGDEYDNQSAASSARLVVVDGGPDECDSACRLVVRVW